MDHRPPGRVRHTAHGSRRRRAARHAAAAKPRAVRPGRWGSSGAIVAAALTTVVLSAVSLLVGQARSDRAGPSPAELTARASGELPHGARPPPGRAEAGSPEATSPEAGAAGADGPAAPAPAQPQPAPKAAPKDTGTAPAPASVGPPRVPVGKRVVFAADYETGDFSQWGTCQSALLNGSCAELGRGDRAMQVVEAPTPDGGRYAARFIVRDGDIPDFGGGERAEVSENDAGALTREGDERWYEWSMRLPQGFRRPTGGWFIVMQWHGGSGSPPLAIDLSQGTVDVGGDGVDAPRRTIGPVRRGEWVDYVLHVKFSRGNAGFVEAWENGTRTVPRTNRPTMSSGENYLKQGIYRDEGAGDGPAEVQFTGLRVTAP